MKGKRRRKRRQEQDLPNLERVWGADCKRWYYLYQAVTGINWDKPFDGEPFIYLRDELDGEYMAYLIDPNRKAVAQVYGRSIYAVSSQLNTGLRDNALTWLPMSHLPDDRFFQKLLWEE